MMPCTASCVVRCRSPRFVCAWYASVVCRDLWWCAWSSLVGLRVFDFSTDRRPQWTSQCLSATLPHRYAALHIRTHRHTSDRGIIMMRPRPHAPPPAGLLWYVVRTLPYYPRAEASRTHRMRARRSRWIARNEGDRDDVCVMFDCDSLVCHLFTLSLCLGPSPSVGQEDAYTGFATRWWWFCC
jgi:hypothetical protein